jgi:hypothetical protein
MLTIAPHMKQPAYLDITQTRFAFYGIRELTAV